MTVVLMTVSHPFGLSRYSKKMPAADESQVVDCCAILMAGRIVIVVVTILSQPSIVLNVFSYSPASDS